MHENCQPDSKTAGLAPLCETMKTMINSLNTLSKNGEIKIQEALSPILHAMKADLEKIDLLLMTQDYQDYKVKLLTVRQEYIDLFSMINNLVERLESHQKVTHEQLNTEFKAILAKYQECITKEEKK